MSRFVVRMLFAGAAVLILGCIPNITADDFQRFRLNFALDREFSGNQAELIHTLFFPFDIKLKKQLVRVSGEIVSSDGEDLPAKVVISARVEDAETGRKIQQVVVSVKVEEDGSFSGRKKIRKNLDAGQLMLVSIQPEGGSLPNGAAVVLCIDLVKKTGLGVLPACGESGEPPPSDDATLSSLQQDFLTPSCSRGGCHDSLTARGGLVLISGQSFANLVNVPSTQALTLDRVEPGDPEASYLIKKLRGDADISGNQMPDGGPFLSPEQLDRFVRWINAGAANN